MTAVESVKVLKISMTYFCASKNFCGENQFC